MTDEALAHLIDKAHERRERWYHRELPYLPPIASLQESTIVGTFSYCLQSTRQRLLRAPDCVSIDHTIESPASLARDFLSWQYKRGPILRHDQVCLILDGMRPVPNVVIPTQFDYGYYIDIQACYWSIMLVVGWNPDYWPEKFLAHGRPPIEFPFPDHKLARNCLASAGLSDKLPIFNPSSREVELKPRGNPLANHALQRVITDVLQAIAAQAIEVGAVYCNNDGFIAPSPGIREKVESIIAEWGLVSHIKGQGPGAVTSTGGYRVGKLKSGRYEPSVNTLTLGLFPPRYHAWLQKAFTFWRAKLPLESYLT